MTGKEALLAKLLAEARAFIQDNVHPSYIEADGIVDRINDGLKLTMGGIKVHA